ncbi:GAF domain-containing protein [Elusimicrobiota bacterium]
MNEKCKKCDFQLSESFKFCPSCSTPAGESTCSREDNTASAFFNVAQELGSAANIDQLLAKIGKSVEKILCAERSSIMLLDETGKNLYFKTASGEDILKKLKVPVGQGVAGWIAQHRKPDIVNDPYNDSRFSPETDKKTGFTTKSIIGAPMIMGDELIGIIEAINKNNGTFTDADLQTLLGFSGLAAVSVVNTRLKADQHNFFSNMLDFLVMGSETLSSPEPTKKGHSWEMARYAVQIGKELGLSKQRLQLVNHASLIHDIGFLGLEHLELVGIRSDAQLTPEQKFKLHPAIGAEMLKGIKIMKGLIPLILCHHRYRNGTGFPDNIAPEKINMDMEIISILEDYMMSNSKENIDTSRYSAQVHQAFNKIIP